MTRRTRILSALGALSAISAPGLSAQSGVLVGVARPNGYETLWIVSDAAWPLHAAVPDLLVPRADGWWWRVGTVPICSTGGRTASRWRSFGAVGETSGQTEECEPRGGRWYQTYYVSRFNGDSSLALARFCVGNVDSLGRLALARGSPSARSS